jgi:hypothetical protein
VEDGALCLLLNLKSKLDRVEMMVAVDVRGMAEAEQR